MSKSQKDVLKSKLKQSQNEIKSRRRNDNLTSGVEELYPIYGTYWTGIERKVRSKVIQLLYNIEETKGHDPMIENGHPKVWHNKSVTTGNRLTINPKSNME